VWYAIIYCSEDKGVRDEQAALLLLDPPQQRQHQPECNLLGYQWPEHRVDLKARRALPSEDNGPSWEQEEGRRGGGEEGKHEGGEEGRQEEERTQPRMTSDGTAWKYTLSPRECECMRWCTCW
jgi:hypothetical protein